MRPIFVFLLALLSPAAFASASNIYRCDTGGHLTFTDRPCGDASAVTLPNPNVMDSPGAAERGLAKQHDERIERERRQRDQADAVWLRQHQLQVARDGRVRSGIVEGKIVRGMTPQQVEEVLGKPGSVSHSVKKGGADQEHWTYKDGDTVQTVTFTDGQVTGYSKRTKAAPSKKKKKAS